MSRLDHLDPARYALPPDVAARTLSPALVVHLDLVRENLRRLVERMGSVDRWRPHVKTTKIPLVWRELARAGLCRFKCATTREAAHLAATLQQEGVREADVLLAYPLVGPALQRLGQVAAAHPAVRFSVLAEDPESVDAVPPDVSIFVDVNPGMNRTGVPLEHEDRILAVGRRAGVRFRGVHYYDGHLYQDDPRERRRAIFAGYDRAVSLVRRFQEERLAVEELVTSGTPAFLHALAYPGFEDLGGTVHRVSPGTVVFHDTRSEVENPELDLVPAATVFARVVSLPRDDVATCDAGSKSIAAEAGDPCAHVIGHPDWVALPPNEEHLPLSVPAGALPPRGTELYLVPRHVCPTVNLAEEALVMEGGALRAVVPVAARGHEVRLGD